MFPIDSIYISSSMAGFSTYPLWGGNWILSSLWQSVQCFPSVSQLSTFCFFLSTISRWPIRVYGTFKIFWHLFPRLTIFLISNDSLGIFSDETNPTGTFTLRTVTPPTWISAGMTVLSLHFFAWSSNGIISELSFIHLNRQLMQCIIWPCTFLAFSLKKKMLQTKHFRSAAMLRLCSRMKCWRKWLIEVCFLLQIGQLYKEISFLLLPHAGQVKLLERRFKLLVKFNRNFLLPERHILLFHS